jgi:hypothetical protein
MAVFTLHNRNPVSLWKPPSSPSPQLPRTYQHTIHREPQALSANVDNMVTRPLSIILKIFIISFRLRDPVYYFVTLFTSDVCTCIVLFLQNMELYLLNHHVKHCDKLWSDTIEYDGFLFMNHRVILSCITATNPTYRTRHLDLYEQTLRMKCLRVLVVRKGRGLTISIFRSHKTFISSFKKHFILKLFLTVEWKWGLWKYSYFYPHS